MPNTESKAAKAARKAVAAATADTPVMNCTWSNNNSACWFTWFSLSKKVLGQTHKSFDEAGTETSSKLKFWNDVAPGDNGEVEARALADVMTKLFTNVYGAKYEQGQSYASAVQAMTTLLKDKAKTLCELAAVIDEVHRFPVGEASS